MQDDGYTRELFSKVALTAAGLTLLVGVGSAAILASSQTPETAATALATDSLVEAVVHTTLRPPNWDIYLIEEPGAIPQRLIDSPALDYNAVFSPDGRWVVFTSERTGSADLYALDLESGGEPVALTSHPAMDDAASFSPDGRRLAFVSTRDGDADIFVMPFTPAEPVAESRAVNLTHRRGGDFNPAFSPDGQQIAFSRQPTVWDEEGWHEFDVELCIMSVDGSGVRTFAQSRAGIPADVDDDNTEQVSGSPAWSPDGEAIYYYYMFKYYRELAGGGEEEFVGDGEIRRVNPDGSDDTSVLAKGYSPAVARDGRVAFVRPLEGVYHPGFFFFSTGQVLSVAADGSDPRAESPPPDTWLDSCFAPDFDRSSGRMVCHGADSSAHEPVPWPRSSGTWPPRARSFAPPGGIRRVELPDRTLEVRGIGGYFPALMPSGEVISTLRLSSSENTRAGLHEGITGVLHVSAVDGSGLRELFVPPSGIAWDVSIAGDAGWAVFSVGPTFGRLGMDVDLWKVRLDGSEAISLTPDSQWNDALPSVSDDGRRIVFRSSRHGSPSASSDAPPREMAVYVMDGEGQDPRRLTDDRGRQTAPAISPDGSWVAWAAIGWPEVVKIWLSRADGSEARLLEPGRADIPDISMHPTFSVDGEWVVFTSDRGGFSDEWPLIASPTPYGDLWAVPVAGGPAVRLTDSKWEDGPNDWGYLRLSTSPIRGRP